MNTTQIIIMWYGGLGVFAILLFSALSEDSASSLIAAIAVLTGLGVVTAGLGTILGLEPRSVGSRSGTARGVSVAMTGTAGSSRSTGSKTPAPIRPRIDDRPRPRCPASPG